MNMNKIMSLAKRNQHEASNEKKIGYSTEVKPAKKLEKTVNPNAIKALLNRKKELEKMQTEESMKKKQQLQKLREDKNTTKRAKAMASRTKDNSKILYDQRYKQKHQSDDVVLSPEAENQHKAFMKRLIASEIEDEEPPSPPDKGGGLERRDLDRKSMRKADKYQKKARKGATMDFQDLLNFAQKQAKKPPSDSSDDSSEEEDSSEEMSVEERLEKERRKRKELEAQLKALKRKKTKNDNSHSEPYFKVGKLDKNLTEEDKQAKVKSLMDKFKKRSQDKNGVSQSSHKPKNSRTTVSTKVSHVKKDVSSSPKLTPSSKLKANSLKSAPHLARDKSVIKTKSAHIEPAKKSSHHPSTVTSKTKHSSMSAHSVAKQPSKSSLSHKAPQERTVKRASNPYAELMQKAKTNANQECTLSVTNAVVRTNYPGVAQTDPKKPTYQKVAPSREMIEAYRRRRAMIQQHPSRRRPQVLEDSDDEYDSEMEGFIDDEEEDEVDDDISMEIGKIFRYDKSKYGKESEYELSKMDASFKDIEREEKRSLKIAQKEDAIEAKRLAEEEMRKKKRLQKH